MHGQRFLIPEILDYLTAMARGRLGVVTVVVVCFSSVAYHGGDVREGVLTGELGRGWEG